ncbi:hypothetical protein [Mycolicibacterium neworleansense]|uniref:Uncharacterized protein n=1 Tax=Mycolicibacterium neworleansense TaxID=146018 RepID=A0A0H5RUP0_9MYCO|nr:hypothetical protein [Mycolicibacterium neworleansense]MCV7360134.1 hypothetical protein [Mycolicibacterium neworleansense]CRZ17262.1 hypothetical protein BN2156_04147 [Mycolicibacterium neworleansense]
MNHPNLPYGQGFTGQPGYPRQPTWPQQPGYPQQPGWPHGYPQGGYPPKPPRGPSGATAIFAAILALLGGLAGLVMVLMAVIIKISDHDFDAMDVLFGLACAACGSALFIGAISLFRHKMIGRPFVVGGCTTAILIGVAALIEEFTRQVPDLGAFLSVAVPLFAFPMLTLVLTLLPATKTWIQAKQNPVAAQYYPPHAGC